MRHKQTLYETFIIFLKGLLMGSADIVPGVSGGTIALVTGIYERLINGIDHAFNLINKDTFVALFTFRFKRFFKIISTFDFLLFVPLFIGIFTAFLSLSNVIHHLMDRFTALTYAFFIGLIIASAILIYSKLKNLDWKYLLMIVVGFGMGFFIVGLDGLQANHSWYVILLSGAIAITAMILPGISGAFMLVLLGQYEYVIDVIRTFDIKIISIFGLGALLGILIFSKLLNYLLKRHEGLTLSFLVGLMLGTVRLQYQMISDQLLDLHLILGVFASMLVGMLLVFLLEFLPRWKNLNKYHHTLQNFKKKR